MADSFLEMYTARIERAERRLRSYVEDPNAGNVHDLRTAVRRMSAALDLLPRDLRIEDKNQEFLAAFRKLAKQNTRVRDIDIIIPKLVKHDKDPLIERLAKNMLEERKTQLEHALGFAREVQKLTSPSLKKRDVSDTAVEKRLDKIVDKLTTRVNSRLPKVLHDPANVEELHLLRIDARKLRYSVELMKGKKAAKLVKILESWQDALGPIHDDDVTIGSLKNFADSHEVQILLNEAEKDRKSNYRRFASLAKEIHA